MNETKKMQRLHELSVKGEVLTAEEQAALQNWYEILDREENSMLNQLPENQNPQDLRQQISYAAKQITKISGEIESLVIQNAALRNENQTLRKSVEGRLTEKVA